MESNRSITSASGGLGQDVDKLMQPDKMLRYAMNARIIYNKDGTFSFEGEKGTKLSFTLVADGGDDSDTYIPIGSCGQSNLKVIFSKSNTSAFSEIGIIIADEEGVCDYKTLFNDQNDPNSDTFDFTLENQIEARFVYENDNLIRAYWLDGVADDSNQPRVFTFKYDSTIGPRNDVNAYSAVTTSVHAANSQAEFSMGLIKYVQMISGNLLSGVYQYTYRLVTLDGYQTPWYPLTRTIFVTTDAVSNSNWNTYEMEGSGIVSSKGNRIEVKGIDQRFDQIELAYVYTKTDTTPFEANVFSIVSIDSDTMTFDHVSNTGEPLDTDTIPAIFAGIRKAKTLNIKEKILYYGNIVEGFFDVDADVVLADMDLTPVFRDMRSDTKNYTVSSPPLTHQNIVTGTTTKQLHDDTGGDEVFQIVGDYINYKGTQVEHLYQGYFRGETYRFGIVFFDKLGFPSFVYHLADVTFPEQYQDDYAFSRIASDGTIVTGTSVPFAEKAWPTNNYGDYTSPEVLDGDDSGSGDSSYLRIMGVEFFGINIDSITAEISGFQIVRCKRDKTILSQGIIMPCGREIDNTVPFPAANQAWYDFFLGSIPQPTSDIGDIELQGLIMIQPATQATTNSGLTERFMLRPNISAWYSPDVMFSPARLPVLQSQDVLKLAGGCWTETDTTISGLETTDYNQWFTQTDNCIQKLYYSKNDFHFTCDEPFPQYGDTTSPTELLQTGLGGQIPDYAPGLDLHNEMAFEDQNEAGFSVDAGDGYDLKSWGKPESLFFIHPDFNNGTFKPSPIYNNSELPLSGTDAPYSGYFIANYKRPNANPYGGQTLSALEQNIFISTGHFQPVNNPDFTAPAGNIYDGVEVWGGDCYLDFFGFLRGYTEVWAAPGSQNDKTGAAYGHVFPFESDINHALREAASSQNPMYTDVGSRSTEEIAVAGSTSFPNGLFYVSDDVKLFEEFNYSAALLYEEGVQFYNPKPLRFQQNDKFPVRWRYTQVKIYGELVDTWRIFQVNDFDDLEGQYGEITSSLYLFDQIYSWQRGAFGRLRASDRALIESANAGSLTTGIGDKLDGIDYISTERGNQHQWSLFSSGKAGYWIDVDKRKVCRFAQDGQVDLSDVHGLHQFAEEEFKHFEEMDNPVFNGGISGVFDFENHDAKWSFVRNRVYEEIVRAILVSQYSAVSNEIMVNDDDLVHIEYIGDGITDQIKIPVNESTSTGVNNLLNFYLYVDPSSPENMPVYQVAGSTASLLVGALIGSYYRIYRNHINDTWSFELLTGAPNYKQYKNMTFSEVDNAFMPFGSYAAGFYTNIKKFVLAYDQTDSSVERQFHALNSGKIAQYFGQDSYTLLDAICSENAAYEKVFDNLYLNCNKQAYDNLIKTMMYTDSQFYEIDMATDTRKAYKEDKMRFPLRTTIQTDRMHGKHIRTLLVFSNTLNRIPRVTNLEYLHRMSPKV